MELTKLDVTPNESNAEPIRSRAAARAKSPIVTRRHALTMAFHQAVAALGGHESIAKIGNCGCWLARPNQSENAESLILSGWRGCLHQIAAGVADSGVTAGF